MDPRLLCYVLRSSDAALFRNTCCTVSAHVGYHFATVTLLILTPSFMYSLTVFVIYEVQTNVHLFILMVHKHRHAASHKAFHVLS